MNESDMKYWGGEWKSPEYGSNYWNSFYSVRETFAELSSSSIIFSTLKMYLSCDLKQLSYKLINCAPGERKFSSWSTAAEIRYMAF